MQSGMNYVPMGKPNPVVKCGEFCFAAIGLDHGHINGMCIGLIEAGATLKYVYDPDPKKIEAFCKMFPQVQLVSKEQILQDESIRLVAGAAVTSERCKLGVEVMEHGKDYFTDKAPLTTLEQLELAKDTVIKTGKKYMCYFAERIHVESAVFAGQLIDQGAIGKVIQTIGTGPHRLGAPVRPKWFFEKEKYGGILCDIGSHQIDQILFYTGATDGKVVSSQIANYHHPEYPELDDFGDCQILCNNGTSGYLRVDWFTPDGLSTWGDGRMLILGTDGYIELRKYTNIAIENTSNHVYLVNQKGEQYYHVHGKVGFPYFGQLVLDCLNRTENAMTQEHVFNVARLCVEAQNQAEMIYHGCK